MFSILKYGDGREIRLEHPDGVTVLECGVPNVLPVNDVAQAVAMALESPWEHPPLSASVTAADRVVLALEPGVPQADAIVAAVVAALAACNISPDAVTLLCTEPDGRADPRRAMPEGLRAAVRVVTHSPADPSGMAYLTVTEDGRPVLLNRALVDADIVIPIGCLGNRSCAEYHGIHAAVYPTFADAKSQARFRSLRVLDRRNGLRKKLVRLSNEVGWLLGVSFTLQVVPGAGDDVLGVVAGQYDAVRHRGRELYQQAWRWEVERPAPLVVAAMQGGADQQTWHHFGQAVATASSLVDDGGVVAVCCDLDAALGPALGVLAESRSKYEALERIRTERPVDAIVAAQLVAAMDRCELYLYSRLDAERVEQLEIAPLSAPEELQRLVRRFPSWILLSNAAHAVVRCSGDG